MLVERRRLSARRLSPWSYAADHRADKRKNAGRSRTGIAHRSLLLRAVEIQSSAWRNYRDVVLPKYFGIVGRGLEGFVSCGAFPSGNFPLPDKARVVPIAHEYDGPKSAITCWICGGPVELHRPIDWKEQRSSVYSYSVGETVRNRVL